MRRASGFFGLSEPSGHAFLFFLGVRFQRFVPTVRLQTEMGASEAAPVLKFVAIVLFAAQFVCFVYFSIQLKKRQLFVRTEHDEEEVGNAKELFFFLAVFFLGGSAISFNVLFYSTRSGGIFLTDGRRRKVGFLKVALGILGVLALLLIPGLPLLIAGLPPFSVLSVGCLLNAALAGTSFLMLWILEDEYNESMDKARAENEVAGRPLTAAQAETAVEIRRLHAHVNAEPTHSREGKLDGGRVRAVHADDFFQLHKWLHALEWAQRNGQTAEVIARLRTEMEERTRLYRLSADDQERYRELARVEAERDCERHAQTRTSD
ncbi:hypothetical protein M3Y99_01058200 [Aphelenchoides fujianensis]|nr:hypothetical protein M3Y99_01058200 [Aphelenchoides fujianensis]